MQNILSIDRSTSQGSFAILADGKQPVTGVFAETLPRSPDWFPSLMASLAECGLAPANLDAIVVGTGPGSFSGIRAVLAAAQGLALPASIPVWGVLSSSAMALAAHRRTGAARVAVIGDARRGSLWLAVHDFAGGAFSPAPAVAPRLVPYAEAAETIAALGGTTILSPDATRVKAALSANPALAAAIVEAVPSALDVAEFFIANPEEAVRDPAPAYLHPAVDPAN